MNWIHAKALREELAKLTKNDMPAILKKASDEKRDMDGVELEQFDKLHKRSEEITAQLQRYDIAQKLGDHKGEQPGRENTEQRSGFGFETKDLKGYSLVKAIRSRMNNEPLSGLEKEVSDEIAKRSNKPAQGFYFPTELALEQRALDLTAGAGAKATITDPANFIELLRDKTVIAGLGARYLTGLVGDLSLPKQSAGGTAYWVTEGNAPTASNATIGQVGLAPKTVGAFTDLSRKFLLQSSVSAEQFVREDLAAVLALAIDRAAIAGSGSGAEPQGLLNNSSVPTTALGTNGAALTYANLVALETAVATANADVGTMAYLTNAKVRGKLKVTDRGTDTAKYCWSDDGTVNGYRTGVTNLVPSNLTKGTANGVCSGVLFGNFNDLIVGMWGAVDVNVDVFTGSTTGTVRVVALQDVDIKVRHAESFAKIVDALTT